MIVYVYWALSVNGNQATSYNVQKILWLSKHNVVYLPYNFVNNFLSDRLNFSKATDTNQNLFKPKNSEQHKIFSQAKDHHIYFYISAVQH